MAEANPRLPSLTIDATAARSSSSSTSSSRKRAADNRETNAPSMAARASDSVCSTIRKPNRLS